MAMEHGIAHGVVHSERFCKDIGPICLHVPFASGLTWTNRFVFTPRDFEFK
jgi:hypothetical protein